jgi:hypothetical protein
MPTLQATSLSPDVLGLPVTGRGLRPGPLGAQLEGEPTLLVFLRHFG